MIRKKEKKQTSQFLKMSEFSKKKETVDDFRQVPTKINIIYPKI